MQRDMDLVRQILLRIEEHEHGRAPDHLGIEGWTEEQIKHHVYLMGQAELLEVADTTTFSSPSSQAEPIEITWDGHDFLDAIKNDTVWQRTKEQFRQRGIDMTFELVKTVAVTKSKELLGLP